MKTTEWLYGNEYKSLKPVDPEAIKSRIDMLDKHLTTLLDVPYKDRDDFRVSDVINAIRFWNKINE